MKSGKLRFIEESKLPITLSKKKQKIKNANNKLKKEGFHC